ncbi:MAG: hypothetical protein IJR97_09940 [Clostridia bacterium]|nr:hypothetical protein [Clostridia bacterium]
MISSHLIRGGSLMEGWTLPAEDDASGIRWAPGAMDGVSVYHMVPYEPDEYMTARMERAADLMTTRDYNAADEAFYAMTKENGAVRIGPSLCRVIAREAGEIDTEAVFDSAVYLMLSSAHIECVKIGMTLLQLYRFEEKDLRYTVKYLGACDEFTLFAASLMEKWENGNEEIFALAKKVRGWGRIHAVEFLKPDTDEIRQWLLFEGVDNDIMPAYSGITCWEKSGAEKILFDGPGPEEYAALGRLMDALLDEGPVAGLSALPNASKVLERFLELAPRFELVDKDPALFENIRLWAEKNSMPDIAKMSLKRLTGD